jgi:hypothetical protein
MLNELERRGDDTPAAVMSFMFSFVRQEGYTACSASPDVAV